MAGVSRSDNSQAAQQSYVFVVLFSTIKSYFGNGYSMLFSIIFQSFFHNPVFNVVQPGVPKITGIRY